MKKMICIILCLCAISIAEETEPQTNFDVSINTSYMSKYMWNGIDMFGSKSAMSFGSEIDFSLTDDIDAYGGITYIIPNGSGSKNISLYDSTPITTVGINSLTESDYYIGLKGDIFTEFTYNVGYDFSYMYHDFTKISSDKFDFQEFSMRFDVKGFERFTPYYNPLYVWDGSNGTNASYPGGTDFNSDVRGWIHNIGVECPLNLYMPQDMSNIKSVKFIAEATYYDGIVDYDQIAAFIPKYSMNSDWTHLTYGLESELNLFNGSLDLGLYYQQALVNDLALVDDDTLYMNITYNHSF